MHTSQFVAICEDLVEVLDCAEAEKYFGQKVTLKDKPFSMYLDQDGGTNITVFGKITLRLISGKVLITS